MSFNDFAERILANPVARAAANDHESRREVVRTLVAHRKSSGMTQVAVANRMGCSQPWVSEFESEARDPQLSTIQRYARAIGVRVTVTVEGTS